MESQRDGDVGAPVDGTGVGIESLPTPLLVAVLALVPVDTRLRCREVARAWRDAVADRRMWARIDFAGIQQARLTGRLLVTAVACAGGELEALNLSSNRKRFSSRVLRLASANAHTLRELSLRERYILEENAENPVKQWLDTLLGAAPALRELHVCPSLRFDSRLPVDEARRLLGGEPRWRALRWQRMRVNTYRTISGGQPSIEDWLAFFELVAAHASLRDLDTAMPPPRALTALVNASLHLMRLALYECRPTPGAGTQLARLLLGGKLTTLEIEGDLFELEDVSGAEEFALAVGESSSLQRLRLMRTKIWSADVCLPLLRALTSHATVRSFSTSLSPPVSSMRPAAGLGAALGALVAANAPALRELWFSVAFDGESYLLRSLAEALPHVTHLRTLQLGIVNDRTFVERELLPAVYANTSLRRFKADIPQRLSASSTIDAFMAARRAADAAAARGNASAT